MTARNLHGRCIVGPPSICSSKKGIVPIVLAHVWSISQQLPQPYPHACPRSFPDILNQCTQPILDILPHPPPICVVDLVNDILELSIPPVLCHLSQPCVDDSVCWLWLWLLWLYKAGEDVPLLAQEGSLYGAILGVHGYCEVQDGRGEGEAPELWCS